MKSYFQLYINQIWNDFVELPESQQEQLVKMTTEKKQNKKVRQDKKKKRYNSGTTSNSCSSEDNFETYVLIENHTTTNDKPSIDPLRRQGIPRMNFSTKIENRMGTFIMKLNTIMQTLIVIRSY